MAKQISEWGLDATGVKDSLLELSNLVLKFNTQMQASGQVSKTFASALDSLAAKFKEVTGSLVNMKIATQAYDELGRSITQTVTSEGKLQVAVKQTAETYKQATGYQQELARARIEMAAKEEASQKKLIASATRFYGKRGDALAITTPELAKKAGATPAEVRAYQAAQGRMIEFIAKQKRAANEDMPALSSRKMNTIWGDMLSGSQKTYTGMERQFADHVAKILVAHRKLGDSKLEEDARASRGQKRALDTYLKNTNKTIGEALISWRSFARLMVVQVAHRAFSAFVTAMREAIATLMEFDRRVSEIRTISQTSQQSFTQWSSGIRQLSDAFNLPILDVAEGAYQAISNQVVEGAASFAFLNDAAIFAKVAVASVSDSVNLLTAALNAYGWTTDKTDDISAKFFKTIELGRVRADEMANTYGRIAVPAHQLGITFDELNASIASTTIQGVQFDMSSTFIRNVIMKLIKPTKEMQKLFKSWGVSSGEAAIKTFGFVGILRKLEDATEGSSEEIGQLFRDMRAITGAMLFSGTGFDIYDNMLSQIKNTSKASYEAAQKMIFESSGVRLQKEINKVKNFFITDVSQGFADTLMPFIDKFGGLVNIIKEITQGLIAMTVALIALKIASKGWQLYEFARFTTDRNIGMSEAFSRGGITFYRKQFSTFTAELKGMGVALLGGLASLGIAAVIAVGVKLFEMNYVLQKSFATAENQIKDFWSVVDATREKSIFTKKTTKDADDAIKQAYQKIAKDTAAYNTKFDESVDKTKANLDTIKDRFKIVSSLIGKEAKDTSLDLDEMFRPIKKPSEVLNGIEKISKKLKEFKNNLKDKAFDRFINFLGKANKEDWQKMGFTQTPDAIKAQMLSTRPQVYVQRYNAEMDLQAGGDRERADFTRAQELLDEYYNSYENLYQLQLDRYSEGEIGLKDLLTAENLILKAEKNRTIELERIQRLQQQQLEDTKELVKQEARKKYLEDVSKHLVDKRLDIAEEKLFGFKFTEEDYKGDVKSLQAKMDTFPKIAAEFKAAVKAGQPSGIDEAQIVDIDKEAEALIKGIKTNFEIILGLEKDKLAKQIEFTKLSEKEGQLEKSRLERQEQLAIIREKVAAMTLKVTPLAQTMQGQTGWLPNAWQAGEGVGLAQALELLTKGNLTDHNLATVTRILEELVIKQAKLPALQEELNTLSREGSIKHPDYDARFKFLQEAIYGGDTLPPKVASEVKSLLEMTKVLYYNKLEYTELENQIQEEDAMLQAIKDSTLESNKLVIQLENLNAFLRTNSIQTQHYGGIIKGFNSGGDTVPAMLTPGEYVVNSRSAARFYPQLVAMNAGNRIAAGGGGNMTIGDITVNVTSRNNVSKETAQSIANAIHGEIRAGRVRRF